MRTRIEICGEWIEFDGVRNGNATLESSLKYKGDAVIDEKNEDWDVAIDVFLMMLFDMWNQRIAKVKITAVAAAALERIANQYD